MDQGRHTPWKSISYLEEEYTLQDEISVTFNCSTNHALLLLALYDVLETDVENSLPAMDYLDRLVDEIGQAVADNLFCLESEGKPVSDQMRRLAAMYEQQVR